jgi:hypothetical protein
MNITILQIPISKTLRDQSLRSAQNLGFSSLQDYVRFMLAQLKNSAVKVTIEPKPIKLSPRAIKRYNKMADDIDKGINVFSADLSKTLSKKNCRQFKT